MVRPHGIYPMLYAFFDAAGGGLDREAFRQQIEVCIGAGCHGIALLGLLTEVKTQTPDERQTLVRWAAEDIADRVPLMATIAGSSLDEVIGLSDAAVTDGADFLILQPPLGAKPSSAELLEFYSVAMAATKAEIGIQNAPEFLGVGLNPEEVIALRKRHANFTLMKGEGPVAHVKPFIDAMGSDFVIFNGRGGLELPDNLLAGCAGMIPAPDCTDVQIAIYEAVRSGDIAHAMRLYEFILPYVVFAMQNLDVAILYGKRMFAKRAGIDTDATCRAPMLAPSAFFDEALERWSARFGAYGSTV